jgi:hypothetical protein
MGQGAGGTVAYRGFPGGKIYGHCVVTKVYFTPQVIQRRMAGYRMND